ncbi:MAG TPA: hypothetical protein EYQ25_00015 [Planctomycetes bacterium]|nr:hypothetical protein [Planctomycetota bacterium]HIL37254.1 hypothetical protein [Planctomycetota bacterium]
MYATMQNIPGTLSLWILLVLILIPLGILLFQWLWNITMPQVFNLNTVTFWQAFRLLLISGFLFKATGGE